MKLINDEYGITTSFEENTVNVLVLEKEDVFSKCVGGIWRQCEGEDEGWILSKKDKLLNFSKSIECIVNPWAVDINNRKIISKLYSELDEEMQIRYFQEYSMTNTSIVNMLDQVISTVPYALSVDTDVGFTNLLKLYNVKFDERETELLDRLVSYVKLMHQVCKTDLFIFVNLKNYFSNDELDLFYKEMRNEKTQLLLIEKYYSNKIDGEVVEIIDRDFCKIDI